LSEDEVARFQTQLPGALSLEIRELLSYSEGFDVALAQRLKSRHIHDVTRVLFTGNGGVELDWIVPCPVALLGDGCGNFWVVDVHRSGAWGAILFVCHDPPVIAIQAPDLASFLNQILEPSGSDASNILDDVRNGATMRIWKTDPWLISVQDARQARDDVVSSFAEQLPENFRVADLRSLTVGSGFSWGKAGPATDIRRNGSALIFGVEQKAPGLLHRILSPR
jgi:hypothetical protein